MTVKERLDRTDKQIEKLLTFAAESQKQHNETWERLQRTIGANEKRWSEERQKWERLRQALSAALDSWLKSA